MSTLLSTTKAQNIQKLETFFHYTSITLISPGVPNLQKEGQNINNLVLTGLPPFEHTWTQTTN